VTLPHRSVQLILAAVAWSGDFGRPTLFNAAIACDFKLTRENAQGSFNASCICKMNSPKSAPLINSLDLTMNDCTSYIQFNSLL
jgi:hypothetical protein